MLVEKTAKSNPFVAGYLEVAPYPRSQRTWNSGHRKDQAVTSPTLDLPIVTSRLLALALASPASPPPPSPAPGHTARPSPRPGPASGRCPVDRQLLHGLLGGGAVELPLAAQELHQPARAGSGKSLTRTDQSASRRSRRSRRARSGRVRMATRRSSTASR